MEGLRAAHDSSCCLESNTDDVVVRLLSGKHGACRLRMNTQHHGFRLLGMEAFFHDLSPYAAGSTELRNLFENVVMRIPEEGETASEIIDIEAGLDCRLNIGDTISDGECDFLGSRGTSLADMIAGNGDRIPFRYILGAELKDVRDETHGRTRREDVRAASCVLFEDIVLDRALELIRRNTLLLSNSNVHSQQYGGRCIDGHGGGNLAEIDLVEEDFHISQGVDGNTNLAYFTLGDIIIRVIADLRRKVKCAGKARSAGLNQITIPLVGFLSRRETCIHTHRPETATVHGRLYAAGIRIYTREADLLCIVRILDIKRRVETLLRKMRALWETCNCLLYTGFIGSQFSLDFFIAHSRNKPPIFPSSIKSFC